MGIEARYGIVTGYRIMQPHISITSFRNLEVYQGLYQACLIVFQEVLPFLPIQERYDLRDQLSRSSKAAPRLVAEGYAKRHQRRGFQRYIDDALAECNECIVSLEQVRDLYGINKEKIVALVDQYDKCARQLYKLGQAWRLLSPQTIRPTKPSDVTSLDTDPESIRPDHTRRHTLTT